MALFPKIIIRNGAILFLAGADDPIIPLLLLYIAYQTNKPTIIALNKETPTPLTNSFQTFFPIIPDFSLYGH